MRFLFSLSFFLILGFSPIIAQLGVGEWRDHFSFKDCHTIISHKDCIYGSSYNGIIKYDLTDNSILKYSKSNLLSDVGISALGSDGDKNIVVGYENGNIDILIGNSAYNMRDVMMISTTNSKRINNIQTFGGKAYLASNLGVLVVNLAKKEISESYYLSNSSLVNPVYQVAIVDSILYAATSTGIYTSHLHNPQIKVFSSWTQFSLDQSEYCDIQPFNGSMVVAKGTLGKSCSISIYNNSSVTSLFVSPKFVDFTASDNLYVSDQTSIRIVDNLFVTIKTKLADIYPFLTATEVNGVTYIAQKNSGILEYGNFFVHDDQFKEILPNGPTSNLAYDINSSSYGVWLTPGGTSVDWNNLNIKPYYSFFNGNYWQNFTYNEIPSFTKEVDLLKIAINPKNPREVTFCSWGSGIYKILENDSVIHYDQHNSALKNIFSGDNNYVRVGGVAIDKNGVTWMNNSEILDGGILAFSPEGNWYTFDYNFAKSQHSQGMILITKNGFKWSFFPYINRGLFVWDDNKTLANMNDDRYRSPESELVGIDSRNAGELQLWDKNGEVITNSIFSLAEDNDGVLWIGTDKGPVLYYRPSSIFDEIKPIASRINIPRNDGSGLGDYLLSEQSITTIAIDQANRKWLGTITSGVYLFSADGTTQIDHFTIENSPLPSNSITDINIVKETGEVFIGTSLGLVSYKGSAIAPSETNDNLIVFPNPVPKGYDGLITVTGLTEESNVKIVDIMGNLVYELTSLGGQILWNGNGFSGERVKSGVYYFLVLSSDGTLNGKAKVMIIN